MIEMKEEVILAISIILGLIGIIGISLGIILFSLIIVALGFGTILTVVVFLSTGFLVLFSIIFSVLGLYWIWKDIIINQFCFFRDILKDVL